MGKNFFFRFKVWTLWLMKSRSWRATHPPHLFRIFESIQSLNVHKDIEFIRKQFEEDRTLLTTVDAGAGSRVNGVRTVKFMAQHAVKPPKAAARMAGLAHALQAQYILELGTCLGTTTAYMARTGAHVTTIEADPVLAQRAQGAWKALGLNAHIQGHVGKFDELLPVLTAQWRAANHPGFDLILIDGNHQGKALQHYVQLLRPCLSNRDLPTAIVCDDIRWSEDMLCAWEDLSKDWRVVVDLGDAGWLFEGPRLTPFHRAVRL